MCRLTHLDVMKKLLALLLFVPALCWGQSYPGSNGTPVTFGSVGLNPLSTVPSNGNYAIWSFSDTGGGIINVFGTGAGQNLTSASLYSTLVGNLAGGSGGAGMTGVENTCGGMKSCYSMTSGGYNTAWGVFALQAETTGSQNTAIGEDSQRDSSGVTGTTSVGSSACRNNSGNLNVCIGVNAMEVGGGTISLGTVTNTVAVGANAMSSASMTTATNDVAVGATAGAAITTASGNVFVGAGAGSGDTTGANNVAVGFNSFSAASNSAVQEVCIGQNTCTKITAGYNNIVIGYNAASGTLANGIGNILIGNSLDTVASGTGSEINIGGAFIGYATAPTLTSGWGTSPTAPTQASTFSFSATVGATGTPSTTGVIGLATAPNSWNCDAKDLTSNVTARMTAQSTTSVTFTWSSAPSNSDVIWFKCLAN